MLGVLRTALVALVALIGVPTDAAPTIVAAKVDTAAAARILSDYRATRGLPPVKVEARLMKIATDHARRMASTDDVDHVLPGEFSFRARMNAGGYDAAVAAEDIAGGFPTLSDVIAAWEKSPEHNANILQPGVSEIGIALYTASEGIYKTYWSLVLAGPAPPPPPPGTGITFGPFSFFGN